MLVDSRGTRAGLLALPPPRAAGLSSVEPLGLPGPGPAVRLPTGARAIDLPQEARAFNESVRPMSKSTLGSLLSYEASSENGAMVAERGIEKSLLASQRTACGSAMFDVETTSVSSNRKP